MRGYEEYKETSDKFCPNIPAKWEMKSGKYCFSENASKNAGIQDATLLQFKYGTIIRKKNQDIPEKEIPVFEKYTRVMPLDIMINGLNLNYDFVSQRVGMVEEKGAITSAYVSLRCRESINPYFANYLLKSYDSRKIFHGMGSGIRLTLGYKELSNLYFPVPTREEQDQIVRFLDWKVSGINKLINIRRREIKNLEELKKAVISDVVTHGLDKNVPMEDGKIEWIGNMPSYWKCEKIGALFTERKTKASDKEFIPLSVAKVGIVPQLETAVKTDAGDNRKLVRAGDFVINSRSDRKGSCGVSELDGSVSLINIVLTPRGSLNNRYIHYLMRCHLFSEEFYHYGRGIVADLWTTRYSEMKNIFIPVPPRKEQNQIVEYLDKKISIVDAAIGKLTSEVQTLEEGKAKIISDTITGKIDVRGIEIPEYEYVGEEASLSDDDIEDEEIEEIGEQED